MEFFTQTEIRKTERTIERKIPQYYLDFIRMIDQEDLRNKGIWLEERVENEDVVFNEQFEGVETLLRPGSSDTYGTFNNELAGLIGHFPTYVLPITVNDGVGNYFCIIVTPSPQPGVFRWRHRAWYPGVEKFTVSELLEKRVVVSVADSLSSFVSKFVEMPETWMR